MSDGEHISSGAMHVVKLDDCEYKWSQTLKEVEISIPVPQGTRGKDVAVSINKRSLSAGLKGKAAFFNGPLVKEIHVDESTWTIDEQRELNIHLEKVTQDWWKCIIEGHPEIDTTKIQPENSKLGDLDGETRSMVEKMMVSR